MNRLTYAITLTFCSIALLLPQTKADQEFYDEVYDHKGNVRAHYKDIHPLFSGWSSEQEEKFKEVTKRDFQNDNALGPIPRILTESEYALLKKGTVQRAKAIAMFLRDHYSGEKKYLKDNIIPESVIKRIIQRNGEESFEDQLEHAQISFPYGPDIIRDAEGVWRVLEDNIGYIGGIGDLLKAREVLFNRMDYQKQLANLDNPMEFFQELVQNFRAQTNRPKDRIVFFLVPPYPDNEDLRLKKIWKSLNVDVVTPFTKKKLKERNGKLYLEWTNKHGSLVKRRVGYLILNSEYHEADSSHEATKNLWLVKEAKMQLSYTGRDALPKKSASALAKAIATQTSDGHLDYDKIDLTLQTKSPYPYDRIQKQQARGTPGLTSAVLQGNVRTNYTPGTDFVGDKEFYLFMEDLIGYYLGEKPILRNVPTKSLYRAERDGSFSLNEKVFKDLIENLEQRVAKPVDGRSGDGVFIGPRLQPKEVKLAIETIKSEYDRYITQTFMHPSVVGNDITDLRLISQVQVDPHNEEISVIVSNTPWSRAVPRDGNGKVNLGARGHELAVLVKHRPQKPKLKQKANLIRTSKFKLHR